MGKQEALERGERLAGGAAEADVADDATGIDAYARHGDVTVISNAVVTGGNSSTGVSAISLNGNSAITSASVMTTGSHSSGIFGYASDEAVGRSLDLIIPERLRQRHWDGFRRTMETGHSRYGEGDLLSVPAVCKRGAAISVEFTIVPLKAETGRLSGMIAIVRDVTKRFEETRQLRQKLAAATKA